MRPIVVRWTQVAVPALALCLAMMIPAAGALADNDDSNGSSSTGDKEIRVYSIPDGDADADVVVGNDDDDSQDAPRGYLGVSVQDVTRELQEAKDLTTDKGALVSSVSDESPADDAGILRGDVIVQVNKRDVDDASDLVHIVSGLEPGAKVPVVVIRKGARKTLTVTIGKRPAGWGWMGHGRGNAPMVYRWNGQKMKMPMPPMPPEALEQFQSQRQQILDELNQIQEQLTQLREKDMPKLQAELQSLRDELAREKSKANTR
jgi:membrane-associated protease RseP (regulator of RpoE activity)